MNDDFADRADAGAEPAAEPPPKTPPRGPDQLSAAHRRRMLAALNRAAQAGDVSAQAALVELSLASERDAKIADALARLKNGGAEDGA